METLYKALALKLFEYIRKLETSYLLILIELLSENIFLFYVCFLNLLCKN